MMGVRAASLSEAMTHEDAQRLLDRIGVLSNPCDLDLLMFFAAHPRSLLTSESLASFLGYELKEIADSLETLLVAGLLTRLQSSAHAARLYVFAIHDANGSTDKQTERQRDNWLPSLLTAASTRAGRLVLRRALVHRRRRASTSDRTAPRESAALTKPGPQLVVQPTRRTGTE
jgi:predicted transcriptional regulator